MNKRYEIKFIFNKNTIQQFYSWMYLNTRCKIKYDTRIVNSLYFDDLIYSSVNDNIIGLPKRQKYRLRWYGEGHSETKLGFTLEKKVKYGRLGYKEYFNINNLNSELLNMNLFDLSNILRSFVPADNVFNKDLFLPCLYVNYTRQYFESDDGLRITIDDQLKYKGSFLMHNILAEHTTMKFSSIVVELKFPVDLHEHVSRILTCLPKSASRHSKYLAGLAFLGRVNYL